MRAVTEYLQSYNDYFWHYEDNGKVIAVPNGHTLGYSEYILKEIIFHLANQGLPRFGSLLLALAATNSQGLDTLKYIFTITSRHINSEEVNKGLSFLKLLTQLPSRYKKGNLRLELIRGIFMSSHNSIGKKRSLQIVSVLKNNSSITSYSKALKKGVITKAQLINDFKTLRIIGGELNSVEAIMVRISGLPQIEKELEQLDLTLEKQAEEDGLVALLTRNHETFHVGALVSRLMSGLHIPFHSSLPSEQPLGGVADITNKGNFDKLLMSEFAFDDHILMSRLANNESLYHHREVPPADNNYSRVILIDTTIKNWGTIRSISFAAMLAITNHPKNINPCRVFLVGKSYVEIKFETVDDVIDGLQFLDSSLDPGIGLMKLFTTEDIKISEMFFIGSMESLKCSGMQLFIAELGKRIDHWIHPDEDGNISVYKNPKRGKRFIQELKLPLNELWTNSKRKRNEITTYTDYNYPILFPEYRFKTKWVGERHSYAVTKKKALLRSFAIEALFHKGWELVIANFLPSDLLKAVMTHNDLSVTVLVANEKHRYTLVNHPSGERIEISNSRGMKYSEKYYVEDVFFKSYTKAKTLYIDLEGNVMEKGPEFKVKEESLPGGYNVSVYQNLKRIYITDGLQLRFGKQGLGFNNSNLYLSHTGEKVNSKIAASLSTPGIFIFPEGSIIEHNRNGMLILISSNNSIPKIYIPCILQIPLGVATAETFAGNEYFLMDHKVEILLYGNITNKLAVVKLVKQSLSNVELKQAKNMVDIGLISSNDEAEIRSLKTQLKEMNISHSIRIRGRQQQLIRPFDFYNKYIQEYIKHIVKNGTLTH